MIEQGWLDWARKIESPHFNERPERTEIALLVIHNISLPPGEFAGCCVEDFFCGKLAVEKHPYFAQIANLRVSAHLFIRRCGAVIQFVAFDKRAWHAGASSFKHRTNCNDFSIGIELEGTDDLPYTDIQYQQLVCLTKELQNHYPLIDLDSIKGHAEIAPGRKTDPGQSFDWPRYRAALRGLDDAI